MKKEESVGLPAPPPGGDTLRRVHPSILRQHSGGGEVTSSFTPTVTEVTSRHLLKSKDVSLLLKKF